MNNDIESPSGMSSVTVTNLQQDVASVQSMNLVFGGALIILSIVVTGIVCVIGNIPIPYVSAYYAPASYSNKSSFSPQQLPAMAPHVSTAATSSTTTTP